VFGGNPVQPDGRFSGTDLAMDGIPIGRPMNASCSEPKRFDQEVVCRRDVPVCEHRNDSIKGWHGSSIRVAACACTLAAAPHISWQCAVG
jgi:hypothetical protein